MIITLPWADLKDNLTNKKLQLHHEIRKNQYWIFLADGVIVYQCFINIDSPPSADQLDFETNYKTAPKKRSSMQVTPFSSNKVEFRGHGVFATVTKGTTQDIDIVIPEARLVNGGLICVENAVMGDKITCQIIDKDGVYAPAGTVLNEWLTDWYVVCNQATDLSTPQAGNIPAGVYLRVKYTSIGTVNDVKVIVNYRLNKEIA